MPLLVNNMKLIPLASGWIAKVDDEDFDFLIKTKWHCNTGYACSSNGLRMHRVITQAPDGMHVDHIDGNKLNNQKSNLRICTNAQNRRNQKRRESNLSGFKGVRRNLSPINPWTAQIKLNNKQINLGVFKTAKEAALAYDVAAKIHHGEFARLNYPATVRTRPLRDARNPSSFRTIADIAPSSLHEAEDYLREHLR